MSVLSKAYMHDEAAAFAHVEAMLWGDTPSCPHCGNCTDIYELKGEFSKPSKKNSVDVERHGLKKCSVCRKQFPVLLVRGFFTGPHWGRRICSIGAEDER